MKKPMPWTKDEIKKLKEARKEGLTISDIHSKLFPYRTFDGVEHKIKRSCVGDEFVSAREKYNESLVAKARKSQEDKAEEKWAMLQAAITESMCRVKEVPCIVGKKQDGVKRHTEIPVLHLTDLHIGERHEGTTDIERYNKTIFEKRMAYLTSKVIHITQDLMSKSYNLPELRIIMSGDIVSNEVLFPGQPFEIDMVVMDQIFEGAKIIAENINEMSKYFPKIIIDCVPGNHGRIGKFHSTRSNFDIFFYKALQAALQNNKRIKIDIEEHDFKKIVEIMGQQFMIFHGDRIKMSQQVPYYGITAAVSRWVSMFIEQFPKLKYFVMGHFHTASYISFNNRKIIMGGTFNPGGQFVSKEIRLAPSLSQWLFGVNEKRITWKYELDVSEVNEKTDIKKYTQIK